MACAFCSWRSVVGWVNVASAADQASQVQEKTRQVQSRFPAWAQSGGDASKIGPLGQKLDGYIKAKDFEKANAVLDEMLAIIGSSPTANASTSSTAGSQRGIGPAKSQTLGRIPDSAEIIFSRRNLNLRNGCRWR
jgi:hypothetical protein